MRGSDRATRFSFCVESLSQSPSEIAALTHPNLFQLAPSRKGAKFSGQSLYRDVIDTLGLFECRGDLEGIGCYVSFHVASCTQFIIVEKRKNVIPVHSFVGWHINL